MTEIFDQQKTFADLKLQPDVLKGVTEAGFIHPTAIQAMLIPPILTGSDVIGQAKTGTGKTAAFGLPILTAADPSTPMQALILVPTRELAVQVAGELEMLGKYTSIRTACIIGGESSRHQVRSVQDGGHILVGTPGRVMDLYGRGEIHFENVAFAVLDEVDRMLDIGFREDIRKILKSIKRPHQTIFVSATLDENIERLARTYMKPDAQKIITFSGSLTVSLVDQKYLSVEPWDKKQLLLHLIRHEKPETTVVFCRTKATVHRTYQYLKDHGIDAREIHGDLAQAKRNKVMDTLRAGKTSVLVASDLAARGLDIEHITHVINYDLPDDPELYIHRIGRTARAGRKGVAWTFVTREQGQHLTEIEKLAGVEIVKLDYPDFTPGPVPDDVRQERSREHIPRADPSQTMNARATITGFEDKTPEELAIMFPGGIIPKSAPPRTLGSKLRTRKR